ncbi:MAG: hypothetical protein PHI24_13585 [Desulfitobacteriaceae bacterium]|nr:hypothetical protein [Desulfitobacteriaceae bacterium]
MAKSSIIRDLASGDTSVEVALNRLYVIAHDLENQSLISWIEKELNGYKKDDSLPDYRIIKGLFIRGSGINGAYKVTNQPIPITYFPEEFRDEIVTTKIYDGIKAFDKYITEKQSFGRDLTFSAGYIAQTTGIQYVSIEGIINKSEIINILSTVKTKVLKSLISLEKEFGNLDGLDINTNEIPSTKLELINEQVTSIVFDNSVNIGDNNKIGKSKFFARGK